MPQAVQVETQAEPQGLALLHGQQAAWGAGREFALHRREDALDQSAVPIDPARKRPPHFMFAGFPLNIRGCDGSPIRAVASVDGDAT